MLSLNPDQLCAAYRLLRSLEPFVAWNLPHEQYIEFQIVRDPRVHGWHKYKVNSVGSLTTPIIAISENSCGHLQSVLFYTAHEMVHLAQSVNNTVTRSVHNKDFRMCAKLVCDSLGFDYKVFV